jgi:hypothetical protein
MIPLDMKPRIFFKNGFWCVSPWNRVRSCLPLFVMANEWAHRENEKLKSERYVAISKARAKAKRARPLTHCAADRDGDCSHRKCPQLRDKEPRATGRNCPLPDWDEA